MAVATDSLRWLDVAKNGSQFLLVLTSRDAQRAAQLAQASSLSPAEALHELERLVDQGFIIASEEAGAAVYRLTPKGMRPDRVDLHERVLVVEDDVVLRGLLVEILEAEGYAVIAAGTPIDATALLDQVRFDLVITDGFSRTSGAVLSSSVEVLEHVGKTPAVLLTAHKVELDAAKAAGFRDLIAKPFDIDRLLGQIRTLLDEGPADRVSPAG